MNTHSLFSDFSSHVSSIQLSHAEEQFTNESCNNIKKLKENNNLFHFVKDVITKQLQENHGYGMSLGSIEKIFQRINSDPSINQDPEFIKKIKQIFLEQYTSVHRLQGCVDAADTEHLLTYLLTKDLGNLCRDSSFLMSLSKQSQLQLITLLAEKSESDAQSINFYLFDKITELPIEMRLEIAKLIANQGEKAAKNLCAYQLQDLHLQNATLEQKLDLAASLLEGRDTISDSILEGILNLQAKEPKEAYLAFSKAILHKFVIEPKKMNIDLDKLTNKEISLEEKLIIAKKAASFDKLTAQYVGNLVADIHDLELITLLVRKDRDSAYYNVLEHLSAFNLTETPIESRLELAQAIFSKRKTVKDEPYLFKIIDALISPNDTLENRIHFVQILFEDWYCYASDKAIPKIMEAFFKKIPGGISISELADLIKKNNEDSRFVIEYFKHFNCSATDDEIFSLVPVICDQGEELTSLLAFCIDNFKIQNMPLQSRLEVIKRIFEVSQGAAVGLADRLQSLLSNMSIQERLNLAKTLIQRGDAAAAAVASRSKALNLEEATVQDRLDLALLIAQQGKSSARELKFSLGNFFLKEAPPDQLFNLADMLLTQGQAINMLGPKEFNIKAITIPFRYYLVTEMIEKGVFDFNKAWLEDMSWTQRLSLAKQALSSMIDYQSKTPNLIIGPFAIPLWDLHDVPFNELCSFVELYMQQGKNAERSLGDNFLSLFGHNINGAELITMLKLFSRQSTSLLSCALKQLTSPPLSLATCRQAIMEFLIDTPLDLQLIYGHPALQGIKPLLNLLTMKTLDVQEEVNITHSMPKDVQAAKLQLKQVLETKEEYKSLRPLYSDIEKITNPMLQFKLMRWLAYTAGKFTEGASSAEQMKAIEDGKVWEDIYAHQSISNRFIFVRELSHMSEPFHPRLEREFNEYGKLSWILLTKFRTLGIPKEQLERLNDLIDGKKKFKETRNFTVLVELLNEVILMPPLQSSEAKLFCDRLEEIIQLKTMDQTLLSLQTLTNILIVLGRENFIKALSQKDINAFFFKEFEKIISLGNIEDFGPKWQKTFGKSRNPNAIFIYLRSLERLPLEERNVAKEALGRYITSVLNGDFPAIRYKTENQTHLAQIFATEEMKKLWLDKGKPIEVGNYQLSFSDDFMDLLLSGTEVPGSCQDIAGDPHLNKCLIFSLLHGGIIPIVARQKGAADGKMAARCFLRLGWDKQNNRRVLLQEAIYSNKIDAELYKAMNQMALDKAKQLGIPLVENDKYRTTHGSPYEGTFSFLGGDYPYVYSDAAGGVKDGIQGFDITDCKLVTSTAY